MRETIVGPFAGKFVGHAVRRVEDPRLLTGEGRYVDDVQLSGMLHAAFVRSPHAHAHIRNIEVAAARRSPGVVDIITGAEMETLVHPFIGMLALKGLYDPRFYALSSKRVRHVGDPVAIVIAESRAQAEDAIELVEVSYETIEAVANASDALDSRKPPLWDNRSNVLFDFANTYGEVDAAFAGADRVISHQFKEQRVSNQPMETRGIVVEIDPKSSAITVHAATQSAHMLKWVLALLSDRASIPASIKTLAINRDRVTRFAKSAKAILTAKPELKEPSPMMPAMVKQFRAEPSRFVDLQRAMLGLLAKSDNDRPEVLARDIGGAFGTKGSASREDLAVYAAARKLGRSVKWIEDRNEHLMGGGHSRDEIVDISMAVRNDGTLLGMKVSLTLDQGAYPAFPFGGSMFSQIIRVMFPGPYRVPVMQFNGKVVATNKGTLVAYRGPWAVETFVRERMFDMVARELGITAAEVRLRNIVTMAELPTPMITGPMLDVRMSAHRTLVDAIAIADYDNWPAAQLAARANGKILGLGIATFCEAAPGPPDFFEHSIPGSGALAGIEPAKIVLEADGMVAVITQQVPHGQGHETTLAQVAADQLGIPIEAIRVRYGDTKITPFAMMGTGGSRSAAMAGGVVTFAARELKERIVDIAADLMEASREDIVIEAGNVHVAGVPARGITLADIAVEARRRDQNAAPGEAIRVAQEFDGGEGGWTQATHACWVEVDLETGQVAIPRYVVVEDCGEIINPAIVDGQIRGGIAQGIGQVLYEKITYDDAGQFQTGTFMDYLIPTACEIPDIEIHHIETPSEIEANYRGVGEGGMVVAPAALTNAIENALAHLGVRISEPYLPPSKILELAGVIQTARSTAR